MPFIRKYGASVASYSAWATLHDYILGDFVEPTNPNEKCYECTTAGKSKATEPPFPNIVGQTVTDGTVIWTCRDKASSPVALSVQMDMEGYGGMSLCEVWVKSDGATTFTIEASHTGLSWRWIKDLTVPFEGRIDRHEGFFNAYRFVRVGTEAIQLNEIEIVAGGM